MVSWKADEQAPEKQPDAAVPPSSFYANTASNPPPAQSRDGSSHTQHFVLDSTDPASYREPELVSTNDADDDNMPPLQDADNMPPLQDADAAPFSYASGSNGWKGNETRDWEPYSEKWDNNTVGVSDGAWTSNNNDSAWDNTNNNSDWTAQTTANWDSLLPMANFRELKAPVRITGRESYEEERWWDAAAREYAGRPGAGMLPSAMAERLHSDDHTLLNVTPSPPEFRPSHSSSASTSRASTSSPAPAPSPAPDFTPPTPEEVRESVPHPSALYCRKHNGWILLHARSSALDPHLVPSFFSAHPDARLPDLSRRKAREKCCAADDGKEREDETHHLHLYERAVDARYMPTPFVRQAWEKEGEVKKRRRAATVGATDEPGVEEALDKVLKASASAPGELDVEMAGVEGEAPKEEEEGLLLDMYVCCQCQFRVLASPDVIPGVISVKDLDELIRDKEQNPQPGQSGPKSALLALETIINVLQNLLWKGEHRVLPVTRSAFKRRLGWSSTIRHIFDALGFTLQKLENNPASDDALAPPSPSSLDATARKKLLRAWVELGAFAGDYIRRHPKDTERASEFAHTIKVAQAREEYQRAIGAHPDQLPRNESRPSDTPDNRSALAQLGLTSTTCTPTLLAFAYLAQARCAPQYTPDHFIALQTLLEALKTAHASTFFSPTLAAMASSMGGAAGEASSVSNVNAETVRAELEMLENLVVSERERNRWMRGDEDTAAKKLGFGRDAALGIELSDADDEFVERAWRHAVTRAWRAPAQSHKEPMGIIDNIVDRAKSLGTADFFASFASGGNDYSSPTKDKEEVVTAGEANDAVRVVAEARGSTELYAKWEKAKSGGIQDPGAAFRAFNVEESAVDDALLITAFEFHCQDSPSQRDRLREALAVIAEYRDSDRLRKFLEIGVDPGDLALQPRRDWPRGLNQLGNTCYLNSLLQYFYTIKDLREALAPLAMSGKFKLDNDDEMGVPGSSKLDEESEKVTDDELARHRVGGRLVTRREIARSKQFVHRLAELFVHMQTGEPPAVTPSLALAKLALVTSKDEEEDEAAGRVDERAKSDGSNDTDATLVDDAPPRVVRVESPSVDAASPSSSVLGKRPRTPAPGDDSQMDVDSPAPPPAQQPPALPPRPAPAASSNGGGMMFGKQHDVSECMDNCIFQIETALLKFGGDLDAEGDKTSLVKRLFFGKVKQRIVSDAPSGSSSMHEREDIFSLLPVNVAGEGTDIYDGLSSYFSSTVELGGRVARMEMALLEPPPVLQIQLQRAQFDRASLTPYKNQAYVRFGETLALDRFLDGASREKADASHRLQRELEEARERLLTLGSGPHAPYEATLTNTTEFLREAAPLGVDDDLLAALAGEQMHVKDERAALQARVSSRKAELEALWAGDRVAEYELTSVFIHRGSSPSFGHYFFYSRNLPHKPDEWFKYNDAEVSLVGKEEVLKDTTGSTANPYMLVYVRKGANIIDTVDRIDEAQSQGQASMDTK